MEEKQFLWSINKLKPCQNTFYMSTLHAIYLFRLVKAFPLPNSQNKFFYNFHIS